MMNLGEHTTDEIECARLTRSMASDWVGCAWVLAAGAAACAVELAARCLLGEGLAFGGSGAVGAAGELARLAAGLLWESVEAGVVEEVVFRGALLFALVKAFSHVKRAEGSRGFALCAAALASTLAFAFAHVATALPGLLAEFDLEALLALALKFAQAFLFGTCMCALAVARRSLLGPVLVHVAFDLLYFAPSFAFAGGLPASYAMLDAPALAALSASILLLLPPCAKSALVLRAAC